jgi:hypothetical protein
MCKAYCCYLHLLKAYLDELSKFFYVNNLIDGPFKFKKM